MSQIAYCVSSTCNSYFLWSNVHPLAPLDVAAIDRPTIRLIRELFPTPLSPKTTMFLEELPEGCSRRDQVRSKKKKGRDTNDYRDTIAL